MCYTVIWKDHRGRYYATQEMAHTSRSVAWKEIQSGPSEDQLVMLVMGHHEVFAQKSIDRRG